MGTAMMTLFSNPQVAEFPCRECIKPGTAAMIFAKCLNTTAFVFSWKLRSRCSFAHVAEPYIAGNYKRMAWEIRSSVDGSGLDPSSSSGTNRTTRLIRAIQDLQRRLGARIQEIRKNLPMKLLFFLVGFYCATAFATVIGQTGDWDILSAALAVVVVEGIGAVMYKSSFTLLNNVRSLITMFNYWKAGLCLGLFLDSFKYEMDNLMAFNFPFALDVDIFAMFL